MQYHSSSFLKSLIPATTPEARVAMTGLCLSLILLSGLKSSPSLAMAKRTRGIGNIDPRRLQEKEHNSSIATVFLSSNDPSDLYLVCAQ